MPDLFLAFVVCVNAYFLLVAFSNVVYFRRATSDARIRCGPFVSVIVPARNEERSIARCLDSLLDQDYARYEVIVVDDESTDATAAIVEGIVARDPRVRLVRGAPLPSGWLGKTHAMSQGAAVAAGEVLLLTDADTVHSASSISWAVTNLEDHHADMLSGYLEQVYGSLGERIIVPTMYAMLLLLPLLLIPRVRSPRLAFAIGQYVVMRRAALDGVGGFEANRVSLVDDMSMAIRMKESGYRNVFLDASKAARCRLYTSYPDAFAGISRSIYSALGGNPVSAIAVGSVLLTLIVWPALAVVNASVHLTLAAGPVSLAALLFACAWALVTWDRDVPLTAFLLYPVVFANLVIILATSMVRTGFGHGVDWKGRRVRTVMDPSAAEDARLADAAARAGKGK